MDPIRFRSRRREQGGMLVTALIFTGVAGLLIGGTLAYTSGHMNLSATRRNSEAALQVAEAGINDELRRLTIRAGQGEAALKTYNDSFLSNQYESGQPYPGRTGTVKGVNGRYWVIGHSDRAATNIWDGERALWITAVAEVNGAMRRVQVGSNDMSRRLFDEYAVFGVYGDPSGNQAALGFTGQNNNVTIEGTIATNGYVGSGNFNLTYEHAINFNTDALTGSGKSYAFPSSGETATAGYRESFPSVLEVARQTFGMSSTATQADVVAHIKGLDHNGTRIRRMSVSYSNWASVETALGAVTGSAKDTLLPAINPKAADKWGFFNKSGNKLGWWDGVNSLTGILDSVGNAWGPVKIVVIPPGDYFFETLNLDDDVNTVTVVDNGNVLGLVPNNNDGSIPQTRIWMLGKSTNADYIRSPMHYTDTSPKGAMQFRLFYGKEGGELEIVRKPNIPFGDYIFRGGFYSVTNSDKPTQIDFVGQTSDNTLITVYGSLIADRVEFNGNVKDEQPPTMGHPEDTRSTFVFKVNYREY